MHRDDRVVLKRVLVVVYKMKGCIIAVLLFALILAVICTVHAYTITKAATYIHIPIAPGPEHYNRTFIANLGTRLKVILESNGSATNGVCIDLLNYTTSIISNSIKTVEQIYNELYGNGFFAQLIYYDVKFCVSYRKPKFLIEAFGSPFSLYKSLSVQNGTISIQSVGGKLVKVLFTGGSSVYLNILAMFVINGPEFVPYLYTADVNITLSSAEIKPVNNSGLVKGYMYTVATYPLNLLSLAFTAIPITPGPTYWEIINIVKAVTAAEYALALTALGQNPSIESSVCIGDICVICTSSWTLNEVLNYAKDIISGKVGIQTILSMLFERSKNCKIINITSERELNVNQETTHKIYLEVESNNVVLLNTSRTLKSLACNYYWCSVSLLENYPVKSLSLNYVKPNISLYFKLEPLNIVVTSNESGYGTYNYTHTVVLRSFAIMQRPKIVHGSLMYMYIKRPLLLPYILDKPRIRVVRHCHTYYIYNVSNSTIMVEVPTYVNVTRHICIHGISLEVNYTCKLYEVKGADVINETTNITYLLVNSSNDAYVDLLYNCSITVPIPYITSLTCAYSGNKTIISGYLLDLGASGTVYITITADNNVLKTIPVQVTTGCKSYFETTIPEKSLPTRIVLSYLGTLLGACLPSRQTSNLVYIFITNYTNIRLLLKSILSRNLPKSVEFINGSLLQGIVIISNTSIEYANINGIEAPCYSITTNVYMCNLSTPILLSGPLTISLVTSNGTVTLNTTNIPVESPSTLFNNMTVYISWEGLNMLKVIIVDPTLALHDIPMIVNVGPLNTTTFARFMSNGTAILNVILPFSGLGSGLRFKLIAVINGKYANITSLPVLNFYDCMINRRCQGVRIIPISPNSTMRVALPQYCKDVLCNPTYINETVNVTT